MSHLSRTTTPTQAPSDVRQTFSRSGDDAEGILATGGGSCLLQPTRSCRADSPAAAVPAGAGSDMTHLAVITQSRAKAVPLCKLKVFW